MEFRYLPACHPCKAQSLASSFAPKSTQNFIRFRSIEFLESRFLIAEGKNAGNPLINSIDKDLKDEKAIKNAITRFYDGRYEIYREEPVAAVEEVAQAVEETIEE